MPSSSTPNPRPGLEVESIDALFDEAGLVRNLSGKPAGVTRRMRRARVDRAAPEELSVPAPLPHIASNGVQFLPVPAWEKLRWLWHGFSTRKGGLSRAYCAEDAKGELILGLPLPMNGRSWLRIGGCWLRRLVVTQLRLWSRLGRFIPAFWLFPEAPTQPASGLVKAMA